MNLPNSSACDRFAKSVCKLMHVTYSLPNTFLILSMTKCHLITRGGSRHLPNTLCEVSARWHSKPLDGQVLLQSWTMMIQKSGDTQN